jgi:hypothetical protein
MNDLLRDTLRVLKRAGIKPIIHQGRHIQLRWINDDGRACRLVISRSPSDRNAHRKNRGQLRRLLRNGHSP